MLSESKLAEAGIQCEHILHKRYYIDGDYQDFNQTYERIYLLPYQKDKDDVFNNWAEVINAVFETSERRIKYKILKNLGLNE